MSLYIDNKEKYEGNETLKNEKEIFDGYNTGHVFLSLEVLAT
jgi:hypothetical protein